MPEQLAAQFPDFLRFLTTPWGVAAFNVAMFVLPITAAALIGRILRNIYMERTQQIMMAEAMPPKGGRKGDLQGVSPPVVSLTNLPDSARIWRVLSRASLLRLGRLLAFFGIGLTVLIGLDSLFFESEELPSRWADYSGYLWPLLIVFFIASWVSRAVASSGLWVFSFMIGVPFTVGMIGWLLFTLPTGLAAIWAGLSHGWSGLLDLFRVGIMFGLSKIFAGVFEAFVAFFLFGLMTVLIVICAMVAWYLAAGLILAYQRLTKLIPAGPALTAWAFFWTWVCYFGFSYQHQPTVTEFGEILWSIGPFEKILKFMLAPFVTYVAASAAFFSMLSFVWPKRKTNRLLYLRANELGRRSQLFFHSLAASWTEHGALYVLNGKDVVRSTMNLDMLSAFIWSRLENEFVTSVDDLNGRLNSEADSRTIDLKYRVRDFTCLGSVWTDVFQRLLKHCDAVLLDARGFDGKRAGLAFELFTLIREGQSNSTVVLCDRNTDLELVEEIARKAIADAKLCGKTISSSISLTVDNSSSQRSGAEAARYLQHLATQAES